MLTSGGPATLPLKSPRSPVGAEYGSSVPRRRGEHRSEQLQCEPNATALHMTTTLGVDASSSYLTPTHAAAVVLTRSKELLEGFDNAVI